jgi:hypothetical protein
LESGSSLEVEDLLYVPDIKINFLSVLSLEDKVFVVLSRRDKYSYIHRELAPT